MGGKLTSLIERLVIQSTWSYHQTMTRSIESQLIDVAEIFEQLGVTRIERDPAGRWIFWYRRQNEETFFIVEDDRLVHRRRQGFVVT